MKLKQLIALFCSALLLFSCTDNDNSKSGTDDGQLNGEKEFTFPDGFNCETSKSLELTLESRVPTTVSIYADENCKTENILIDNLYLNKSSQVKFNVPVGNEKVFIQYRNLAGEKQVIAYSINQKSIAKAAVASVAMMPEDVLPTAESDAGFTFYHNTGVVMFEDNWPKKGDYDFNDVVMEYDLKVTECNDASLYESQGYKENLTITMDIRAIGGGTPREIGMMLEGLDKKYIDMENSLMILQKKYGQGREEEQQQASDYKVSADVNSDNLILSFNGLAIVNDYNHSDKFYQVTPGYIETGATNPDHYMVRAKFVLMPNLATDRAERLNAFRNFILSTKNQNFFIRVYSIPDNTEIHLSGYKPTYKYMNLYVDNASEMNGNISYRGNDGSVWGLKVPVGTCHAYERKPFMQAFPKFKSWIDSNGENDKDWYLFPADGEVVRYW